MDFKDVKVGQKFVVVKGSTTLAMRVNHGGVISQFFKMLRKGMTVTVDSITEKIKDPRYPGKTRNVYFDLGGEACVAVWGKFKRATKPV